MDHRLYVAACNGDVEALSVLLEEDRLVLSRASLATSDSPLHIAALLGHTQFSNLLMSRDPELSIELNEQGYSPIHLASLRGRLEIVTELVRVKNGLCSLKDSEGRVPLHCAAIKGRLDVISHLITCCPQSATELTSRNETVLHLVVKNSQVEALKLLILLLREKNLFDELIDLVDEDGNTALQLATVRNRNQMRKILLREANVNDNDHQIVARRNEDQRAIIGPSHSIPINGNESYRRNDFLESLKNGTIILCSLFATFCFDAVLNPPGGVWQDRPSSDVFSAKIPDHPRKNTIFSTSLFPKKFRSEDLLAPNKAMSLALEPYKFLIFLSFDAMCFLSSLTTIILVMSASSRIRWLKFFVAVMLAVVFISAVAVYGSMLSLLTNNHVALGTVFRGFIQMFSAFILVFVCACVIRMLETRLSPS